MKDGNIFIGGATNALGRGRGGYTLYRAGAGRGGRNKRIARFRSVQGLGATLFIGAVIDGGAPVGPVLGEHIITELLRAGA